MFSILLTLISHLLKKTTKQISVDIKTNGYIPTQDFIGVDVDAVAKIRVKTDRNINVQTDLPLKEAMADKKTD